MSGAILGVALALASIARAADFGKLRADLASDDGHVVLAALKELKSLGKAGAPAEPAVVELLKKKKNYPYQDYGLDNVVYPAAFEALQASGVRDDAVLAVAMDYFKNGPEHLGVKYQALDLIADFGEKAAPAVPLLAGELKTGRARSRQQTRVLAALERMGPAAASSTVPALLEIASAAPLGSDRLQALSALSRLAPKDKRVLKAFADAAWKRPGNSEDMKVYGAFSRYVAGYGALDADDLAALAGYLRRFTEREASEDRNPPGHLVSVNPSFLEIARLFLAHRDQAALVMPPLESRIRRLDLGMKEFPQLLGLAGEFGARADPLVPAIYERASARERHAYGFLKPLALKTLAAIGTPAANEKAALLAKQR